LSVIEDQARVLYRIMRARYSLAKAQVAARRSRYGYLALALMLVYLIVLSLGIVVYATSTGIPPLTIMTATLIQVPFYVFVWGFLGGVAWSMYSAAYWARRNPFNPQYLVWHIAHPWISAVLGGAVSLVLIGGLSSISSFDPNAQPGSSLLSLTSFVAGFSTHSLWKLLDQRVRGFLGLKGTKRQIHEAVDTKFSSSN